MPETDAHDLPVTEVSPDSEPVQAPEGEAESDTSELPVSPSGTRVDPLDQMDHEALKAEAKKFRAIAQRKAEKKEPAHVQSVPASTNQPSDLTRELARVHTKTATIEAKKNPEIADNWDEIVKLYVPRKKQDHPSSILEDINDAYLLWKAKNPGKESNPAAELQRTTVVKSGGTVPPVQGRKSTPLIQKQQGIGSWYPKAE